MLWLTLLHSEQPELYGVLAVLSAIGFKGFFSASVLASELYVLIRVFKRPVSL